MSTIEKTLDMFDMWIMLSRKKSGYINETYNERTLWAELNGHVKYSPSSNAEADIIKMREKKIVVLEYFFREE